MKQSAIYLINFIKIGRIRVFFERYWDKNADIT